MKVITWKGDYPQNAFDAKSVTCDVSTDDDIEVLLDLIREEIENCDKSTINLKLHDMPKEKFEGLQELF